MSNFWKIFLLILLNVIVSASVTYGVLYYWERTHQTEPEIRYITVGGQPTEPAEALVPAETADETAVIIPTEESEPEPEITAENEESVPTAEPTPVIRGAKVEITIIRNPGVLSSEALRIVSNSDEVVSLQGWTLEDANGHLLTFPNVQLLRKGIFIEVYSRTGHDTPYEIYWGSTDAVWQSGETAVIRDVFGQIQATYRVP